MHFAKPPLSKNTKQNVSKSFSDENVRDYRFARNQKQKANRIKNFVNFLGNKVNNSKTFFDDASIYFKNCPENEEIYNVLR